MDILKQYDEYLTSNMDEIGDYVNDDQYYNGIDCDWYKYMHDLWKYSFHSFIKHHHIDIKSTIPYLDDLKRTFNNNGCVNIVWNNVREMIIDQKLREIDSDFQ